MAPSPGTSRSLLTSENLGQLPENSRLVEAFIHDQRRNARIYASEAIDQPPVTSKNEDARPSKAKHSLLPMPFGSPILKSRREMQKQSSAEADVVLQNPKKSQAKDLFKSFKHAREDPESEKVVPKAGNKPKRPRSPSDEEERSARLRERRDRRRARHDITKPKSITTTPEQSVAADSDNEARRKKKKKNNNGSDMEESETELTIKQKRRGKVAHGIALMETFTANNVKKARLTLQPQNPGKLFKQARSGTTVKLGGKTNGSEKTAPKPSGPEKKSAKVLIDSKHTSRETHSSPKRLKRLPTFLSSTTSDTESGFLSHHGAKKINARESSKKQQIKEKSSMNEEQEPEYNDGDDRYSESWNIGSQLPSQDSSIHSSPPLPSHQPIKSVHVDEELSPASPVHSEPAVTTMTTHWNLEGNQGAFGRFDNVKPNCVDSVVSVDEKRGVAPATGHEPLATARSRFFFSPIVPIPDHIQVQASNSENAGFADDAVRRVSLYEETHIGQMDAELMETEEREDEYAEASDREPSPVDSLEILLHQNDAEDALYGHLFTKGETRRGFSVWPRLQGDKGRVEERDQEQEQPGHARANAEVYHGGEEAALYFEYEGESQGFIGYGDGDQFTAGNGTEREEEEHEQQYIYEDDTTDTEALLFQRDHKEEIEAYWQDEHDKEDAFMDDNNETIGQDELRQEEEEEELKWSRAAVDKQGDVLPFIEGRTLLMGLGNDSWSKPSGVDHGSIVQRSSTYGQSVQEIEVMTARQLGQYW